MRLRSSHIFRARICCAVASKPGVLGIPNWTLCHDDDYDDDYYNNTIVIKTIATICEYFTRDSMYISVNVFHECGQRDIIPLYNAYLTWVVLYVIVIVIAGLMDSFMKMKFSIGNIFSSYVNFSKCILSILSDIEIHKIKCVNC